MFKPYGPKKFTVKHFRHELHEPIADHLAEVVGAKRDDQMHHRRKRRY